MSERDGYFGEDVAATYDLAAADMFDPNVVSAAVDVLVQVRSIPFRYVWPSELDLMAASPAWSSRSVGKLGRQTIHTRKHPPRLGLAEANLTVAQLA